MRPVGYSYFVSSQTKGMWFNQGMLWSPVSAAKFSLHHLHLHQHDSRYILRNFLRGGIHVMETIFPSARREYCLSLIDVEYFDQVQFIQKQWCLSHWCYFRWLYTDEKSKGRIPQTSTKGCVRTPSNATLTQPAGIVAKRGWSIMIA